MKKISKTKLTLLLVLLLITTNTIAQQSAKTADDYLRLGVEAQQVGKFQEALLQYTEALKLDPKNFGAHFNSGSCYTALQKPEQALSFFKTAAAMKPSDPVVQFSLGYAYGATGHTLEAIDALKEAVRLDPKLVNAYCS